MSNRLLAALILLTVLPLVLLGWISASAVRTEESRSRKTLEGFFQQRLEASVLDINSLLEEIRGELQSQLVTTSSLPEQLSQLRRTSPLVKLTFLVDARGVLLYPVIPEQLDSQRAESYLEIDELVDGRPMWSTNEAKKSTGLLPDFDAIWMPWYRQQGLQLILWIPAGRGQTIGILLNRTAWISRLISRLPDTELLLELPGAKPKMQFSGPSTRIRLIDSQQATIYQWGRVSESTGLEDRWFVLSEATLAGPLSAWALRYESLTPLVGSRSSALPIVVGLAGIALLLMLLGVYVATSLRRQMRLAAQHVSFAGQVSHELRTPLTNIRLYAEMAQEELAKANLDREPEDASSQPLLTSVQRKLSVIEQETQRLGRLCASVLELLKHPHQANSSRCESMDIGAAIGGIVDQFRPALEQAGIVAKITAPEDASVCVDKDALEMALMNLISNVEKYACAGKVLIIDAEIQQQRLCVFVEDRGVGIPRRSRTSIFRPFVRLDSSISVPSGTGIGLSIARQAARRAGGDLKLVSSEKGARFKLELPIQ